MWFFERIVNERKRESEEANNQEGKMSLKNLGSVNPTFDKINKQMSGSNG